MTVPALLPRFFYAFVAALLVAVVVAGLSNVLLEADDRTGELIREAGPGAAFVVTLAIGVLIALVAPSGKRDRRGG